MDNKTEIRDFLVTRRARITPEQAGLPDFGGKRRVAGLRREEVAMLAGVSVDYYVRLERGNLGGVSESVLEALVRALQLDETERAHLFDLARTANASVGTRRRPAVSRVRPGVIMLLDSIAAPAWLRNGRMDILATNALGRALYAPVFDGPLTPPNTARFAFLDPRAVDFWPDWNLIASGTVATLRAEAGKNPYDKGLTDLIGELSTRSEEFRIRWAAHDVYQHTSGEKRLHHPVVGDLELTYEAMQLVTDEGLTLLVYGAEPGTKSADALGLLASWAATEARESRALSIDEHHVG
ncbi:MULTISPECIES: helix-turn-helix transcriptional regulator [unclassified Cryobacterium]|uniref:helix-turn-helix transcriptional regulator n=1 Tax=unclassified Cryobacterium TaxID=2649013 RepID=UPI002AB36B37|nr:MULTISPECIES: helix-turn-helix transcriptional regulator [unclassified Cryobacterium]MDY7529476.1 helix-turn-helix transcriptional regulator [Cryobacterium sp. 10C2]MDY7558379.1 helix-turn-helix transcriptional regulator [Cryobacterium sp. 10C3]MEB0203329.1 helix-turn-helix transcriptional regulator [Cryobacterium sp. 5I3]MEB0291542.1 helix-turn-helix transcriptional regulator [Cryobacterium sp. 10C2]